MTNIEHGKDRRKHLKIFIMKIMKDIEDFFGR